MDEYDDQDEVVQFRLPKNQTTPRYRHLALNAEGIRYLNQITDITVCELEHQDRLKIMIITHLIESEALMEELPSLSTFSHSSLSASISSISDSDCSSSLDSDDSFYYMIENDVFMIEDSIMHFCVLHNISRNLVGDVILELFEYTVLTREEMRSVTTEHEPKKNQRFEDLDDKTLSKWTRFTSSKLYQLKSFFSQGAESETIEIVHKGNVKSKWTIEHIMLIALTYQATGESYSSMVLKFGG